MTLLAPAPAWSAASGVPPAADTRDEPAEDAGVNTMVSSSPQLAPRGSGASQITAGGPPAMGTRFSLPSDAKPSCGAVGREERHVAAFGAGDGLGVDAVHPPHVDLLLPGGGRG